MKVIVVSDSHGKDEVLVDVLRMHPDAQAYIHCGDIEAPASDFPQYAIVRGNNDLFFEYPDERVIKLGNHQLYVTHSHLFSYTQRIHLLVRKAKEMGCDIVCFGHTHVALHEVHDGVHVINPGSLWRSRDGRGPSYAVVELSDDNVDVEFVFIPQKKSKFFW